MLLLSFQMISVGNYVQKIPLNVCKHQQADAPPYTANPLSCSDVPQTNNNEQLVEWLPATRRGLPTPVVQTHVIVDFYVVQYTPLCCHTPSHSIVPVRVYLQRSLVN
jgi:hypothetical protein